MITMGFYLFILILGVFLSRQINIFNNVIWNIMNGFSGSNASTKKKRKKKKESKLQITSLNLEVFGFYILKF